MTPLEHATSRLKAWIRDYGHEKQPVFIEDLNVVLAEVDRLTDQNRTGFDNYNTLLDEVTRLITENQELRARPVSRTVRTTIDQTPPS